MATYAIGDIQGCFWALEALLKQINFDATQDTLWFAGDMVNRGPQSLATLRFIKGLGSQAKCVLGNHDLHLLAAAAGCGRNNSSDTITDILQAPDAQALIYWLRHQPIAYASPAFPNHLMVHAGVLPQWTNTQTLALANEVHTVLRSDGWVNFMAELYGNQPDQWDDSLTGSDRLRVIINALTRMRFCSIEGKMNLKIKENASDAPTGYYPWFDIPNRASANTCIVVGHWSTLGLKIRDNLIALDTGCVWGGCLTAYCLENNTTHQIKCAQTLDPLLF